MKSQSLISVGPTHSTSQKLESACFNDCASWWCQRRSSGSGSVSIEALKEASKFQEM
jgi:hypothetical protein